MGIDFNMALDEMNEESRAAWNKLPIGRRIGIREEQSISNWKALKANQKRNRLRLCELIDEAREAREARKA